MANVTLTLNGGLGSNLGPNFDLISNGTPTTVTPSTATLSNLLIGTVVVVDDSATSITVTSTGTCTNSLVIPIVEVPIGVNEAIMGAVANIESPVGYDTSYTACTEGGLGVTITVYYTGTLGNGTILYFDPSLTSEINSGGSTDGWFWISGHSFNYQYVIGVSQVTNYTTC